MHRTGCGSAGRPSGSIAPVRSAESGSVAGVGLYTSLWEPHWVEFVERRLAIANLPYQLIGDRLVQLSDLHIGPRVDDQYLIRTFDQVRKLSPEIVVYTGDFTSYEGDDLRHAAKVIPQLPSGSKSTVGVLGNHDYGIGWRDSKVASAIVEIASSIGIEVLRNGVSDIDGLQIAGLDDLWSGRFRLEQALSRLDPNAAALVLSHNPDTVDVDGWGSYRGWILSGHTHGGQCKPPFLPPPLLPVRNKRFVAGEYQLTGDRRIYVNRGVGHLLQVRFNVRPEVTVFRLAKS